MQCSHVAFGVIALAIGIGCDSKGSADAEVAAKAQPSTGVDVDKTTAKADVAAAHDVDARVDTNVETGPKPRIGGTIIATGDYSVEILAFIDGRIEALIMDAKGELLADVGKATLSVTLAAEGDARAELGLAWNAELARFVGQVDAGIELVPGPVELALTVDGKASIGTLAELALAVHATHGGQIMIAGAYSLELVVDAGVVHAYAFDVAGRAHAAGDLDIDLAVDAATNLELKWDPPSASYEAELAAGMDLEAKPLVVRVAANGKLAIAAVQSFHASAKVAAAGDLAAGARIEPPSVAAKADASARAGAKSNVKVNAKKSAGASGKASAKIGGGGFKASGSAKAKGGFKIGGS